MKDTPTLSLPTLYLHGDADGVNPPATADAVADKFAGPFDRVSLADVGHFPQRQQPQAVAEHLLRLLDRKEGRRRPTPKPKTP